MKETKMRDQETMWTLTVGATVLLLYVDIHVSETVSVRDTCPRKFFSEIPTMASSNDVIASVEPSTVQRCQRLCRQHIGCTSFQMVWSSDGGNHRCQLLKPVKGKLRYSSGTSFFLSCPEGMSYYGGACYQLVTTPLSWNESVDYCPTSVNSEATLIDVHSQSEWDFIQNLCITGQVTSTWVGGRRPSAGGRDEFYWAASGDSVQFTNWAPNQPLPYNSEHNCILSRASEVWGWNDKDCTQSEPFVCKL